MWASFREHTGTEIINFQTQNKRKMMMAQSRTMLVHIVHICCCCCRHSRTNIAARDITGSFSRGGDDSAVNAFNYVVKNFRILALRIVWSPSINLYSTKSHAAECMISVEQHPIFPSVGWRIYL